MIHAASISLIMHRFREPQRRDRRGVVWRNLKLQILQSRKRKRAGFRRPFAFVVRPERFELPTPWFVAKYSIQMSYGRLRGPDYTQKSMRTTWLPGGEGRTVAAAGYFFCAARTRCARARACSADASSGVLSLNSSQSRAPLMMTRAISM